MKVYDEKEAHKKYIVSEFFHLVITDCHIYKHQLNLTLNFII